MLERYVDVTNRPSEDVLRYAYMNSYYQTGLRNLLDKSILRHEDLDVERTCRKVDELPFDFVRKRMSVVIDYEGDHVLICKGAVEDVFEACDHYQVDDDIYPLFDDGQEDLLEEYAALSAARASACWRSPTENSRKTKRASPPPTRPGSSCSATSPSSIRPRTRPRRP